MTINFNSEWDGGPWSDRTASLGEMRTGPLGLLSILESRCGTSGPRLSHALRIAGMMKVLRDQENNPHYSWCAASCNADRWATAAELLSCRDELLEARIAAGEIDQPHGAEKRVSPGLSGRLAALTGLVTHKAVPGDGIPDRIQEVLQELRSPILKAAKPFEEFRIVVEQPESLLPPVWRVVLGVVADSGASVEYRFSLNVQKPDCAVTLVTCPDQWSAAEHVAALLSLLEQSRPVEDRRPALVTHSDGGVLDQILQQWNLPVTGSTERSAARRGIQILPAFLATVWRPANPQAIAEFFSLVTGLIPSVVAGRLMNALSQHPGTGGPKWTEALERIASAKDAETASFYDRLFAGELFDPDEGIPVPVLEERLRWLSGRLAITADRRKTARIALGHITELLEIIRGLDDVSGGATRSPEGVTGLSRSLLSRILGTVVHPVSMGQSQQAAPWSVHGTAATVPPSSDTVIFWNCVENEPAAADRFTEAERDTLLEAGYRLDTPEATRSRRDWNRRQAFLGTDRHIVAFVPHQVRGEETRPAPWLKELMNSSGVTDRTVDLFSEPSTLDIAGRRIDRAALTPILPPEPQLRHPVRPGTISVPDTLSYSAVSSLIGCPMQWVVGRTSGLTAAAHVSLPAGNQMIGTLTHAIIERIARENAPDGVFPENIGDVAGTMFDELVPMMAAELLQPGYTLTRRRYRRTVVAAVTALRQEIRRLGLRIFQVETFLEAPWELPVGRDGSMVTIRFRGPADMELVDSSGDPFVLDLKYSYSEKHCNDLVARGKALQLAAYAWLIEKNRGRSTAGSGYYLLPRRKLVTDSLLAGADAVDSARSLGEIWRRGERSTVKTLRRLHDEGIVEVTGLQATEPPHTDAEDRAEESGELYVEPPCAFCEYPVICGYGRGKI